MSRLSPRTRRRIAFAAAVLAVVTAPLVAAWIASPGVTDLEARLAAREHATGVHRSVPLPRVSLFLREAVVATEDERFYHNHGIDLIGIARAIPFDIGHLSLAQGASTITDQLAKLIYLNGNDHSPWRKLQDLAISLRISTRYTKEQVLDAYLNSAYFGNDAYGVANATRLYFGRAPSMLDLAQASLLAGLLQAPTAYDPLTHPLAARWRQVDVLRSLVRDGYTTSSKATGILDSRLPLRSGQALPVLKGVSVRSQPAFALDRVALGIALIAVALATLVTLRLRPPRRRNVLVALRWACAVAVLAGAITATNAITAL